MNTEKTSDLHTRLELDELEKEFGREKERKRKKQTLKNLAFSLATVAAVAVLVSLLWMPVLQIHGASMTPTLYENEIVVTLKSRNMKTGDIVAFYYNNQILIKRMIANPGDWVDIDEEGNVYVNGELIDEPYVKQKAFGETNIRLPYQVPADRIFVMGDHRSVSIDSRNKSVGCVADDQIVGKLAFRIWPLNKAGVLH